MLGRSSISVQAITPARALHTRHKHQSRASGFVHGRKADVEIKWPKQAEADCELLCHWLSQQTFPELHTAIFSLCLREQV